MLRVPHSNYPEGQDLNPTQPEALHYQIQVYVASSPERVLVRAVATLCVNELHWLTKLWFGVWISDLRNEVAVELIFPIRQK